MKLVKILSLVIVALVIGNVTLTNQAVDNSLVVTTLSQEISTLHNQNTILRTQVAVEGSIGKLAVKLEEAGYVNATEIASLDSASSVALGE